MTAFNEIRRSWLLAPMSQPERIIAAPDSCADVIVLDLAEFVPERQKPEARKAVRDALEPARRGGAEVFVQIDPELMLADLRAAIWPGIDGIVVSRAETAAQITRADSVISELESQRGMLPGSVAMVAALETALGNHNGFEIATASRRMWGLTLGRADLVMDLRPEPLRRNPPYAVPDAALDNPGVSHRQSSPRRLVARARPRPCWQRRPTPGRRPNAAGPSVSKAHSVCWITRSSPSTTASRPRPPKLQPPKPGANNTTRPSNPARSP